LECVCVCGRRHQHRHTLSLGLRMCLGIVTDISLSLPHRAACLLSPFASPRRGVFVCVCVCVCLCVCVCVCVQGGRESGAGASANPGSDLAVWGARALLHSHGIHLCDPQLSAG